jgi:ANTAR domain
MDPALLAGIVDGVRRDHADGESPGPRLCRAALELLGVEAAAIMLRGDDGRGSPFGWSDDVVRELEDTQFTLGEGPGIDAHASGRPASEPRLAGSTQWPLFAPAAVEAGMLAGFGFPLSVGAVRLGALDLYREQPGSLTAEQVTDARALARIITEALLVLQAQAIPGVVPREIDLADNLRAPVHQASGMLSERFDIGIADALVRLRAHAYSAGRPINDVAADVVSGVLKISG